MDEETRQAFAEVNARMDARFDVLIALMNDRFERVLNRLNRIDRESATTHEYLLEIVKSHGVRLRDIEGRGAA
jgi:hypothetical protein